MTQRPIRRIVWLGATAGLVLLASTAAAQAPTAAEILDLPREATALEGLPDVRVDVTDQSVTRRALDAAESDRERLKVRIEDGRLYWDEDRPLSVAASGAFVYLTSARPGHYVRLRRLNDRLTYVEHVDKGDRSVTYWGELRVVLGD
jgi:hypothetical protein